MFAKIRAQHFTNIFTSLSSYAKQLKMQQAKAANMSINEMKSFVQKELKEMQNQSKAVALHIGKGPFIKDVIYFLRFLTPPSPFVITFTK